MKTLLIIVVAIMTVSSIAVNAAKSSPVDMNQVAAAMAGVHAIDVVDDATTNRLTAAGL